MSYAYEKLLITILF